MQRSTADAIRTPHVVSDARTSCAIALIRRASCQRSWRDSSVWWRAPTPGRLRRALCKQASCSHSGANKPRCLADLQGRHRRCRCGSKSARRRWSARAIRLSASERAKWSPRGAQGSCWGSRQRETADHHISARRFCDARLANVSGLLLESCSLQASTRTVTRGRTCGVAPRVTGRGSPPP